MKSFITILCSFLLICGELPAQKSKQRESKDATELRAALQSWVTAIEKRDKAALEQISATDHSYSGTDGKLYTRAQNIESLLKPDYIIESVKTDNVKVRVYNGNTGIITGTATSKQKSGNETSVARTRFTQTWIKMNGQWKLAAEQSTKAPALKVSKKKKRRA